MGKPPGPGRAAVLLLRVLVSAGLLFYLAFWKIELEEVKSLMLQAALPFLALAIAVKVVDRLLVCERWFILLRGKGLPVGFLDLLRIDFMANFMGILLPSAAGGDVVRVYSLSSRLASVTESLSSFAVDRILSLFALLTTAMVCLVLPVPTKLPPVMYSAFLLLFGLFLLGIALFVKGTFTDLAARLPPFRPVLWGRERLEKFRRSFLDFKKNKWVLAKALGLAYLCQGARVLTLYFTCLAIGPAERVSPVYFFIFVPLVFLVTLVPISLGGLGVREAAFVYFFHPVGLLEAEAFSMSLLAYAVVILVSLPGGLFYAFSGLTDPRKVKEEKSGHAV